MEIFEEIKKECYQGLKVNLESDYMVRANTILDLTGEICPVPFIKTRKALDKMVKGDILEVIVTREDSKVNIIMAAKELGMEIAKIGTDKDGKWHILIRKR